MECLLRDDRNTTQESVNTTTVLSSSSSFLRLCFWFECGGGDFVRGTKCECRSKKERVWRERKMENVDESKGQKWDKSSKRDQEGK